MALSPHLPRSTHWFSEDQLRNTVRRDPLLDFLSIHGDRLGYIRDPEHYKQLGSTYDPRMEFAAFIQLNRAPFMRRILTAWIDRLNSAEQRLGLGERHSAQQVQQVQQSEQQEQQEQSGNGSGDLAVVEQDQGHGQSSNPQPSSQEYLSANNDNSWPVGPSLLLPTPIVRDGRTYLPRPDSRLIHMASLPPAILQQKAVFIGKPQGPIVNAGHSDQADPSYNSDPVEHTKLAMMLGTPILVSPVMACPKQRWQANPDFLIRSDLVPLLVDHVHPDWNTLALLPAPKLGLIQCHYVLVQVRFISLHFAEPTPLNQLVPKNVGNIPYYKTCAYYQSLLLESIQGLRPRLALLVGRSSQWAGRINELDDDYQDEDQGIDDDEDEDENDKNPEESDKSDHTEQLDNSDKSNKSDHSDHSDHAESKEQEQVHGETNSEAQESKAEATELIISVPAQRNIKSALYTAGVIDCRDRPKERFMMQAARYLLDAVSWWNWLYSAEAFEAKLEPRSNDARLLPNMKNQESFPWTYTKKQLAKQYHEITQLWLCSYRVRMQCIGLGVWSLDDPQMCRALMQVMRRASKRRQTVLAILRQQGLVQPERWLGLSTVFMFGMAMPSMPSRAELSDIILPSVPAAQSRTGSSITLPLVPAAQSRTEVSNITDPAAQQEPQANYTQFDALASLSRAAGYTNGAAGIGPEGEAEGHLHEEEAMRDIADRAESNSTTTEPLAQQEPQANYTQCNALASLSRAAGCTSGAAGTGPEGVAEGHLPLLDSGSQSAAIPLSAIQHYLLVSPRYLNTIPPWLSKRVCWYFDFETTESLHDDLTEFPYKSEQSYTAMIGSLLKLPNGEERYKAFVVDRLTPQAEFQLYEEWLADCRVMGEALGAPDLTNPRDTAFIHWSQAEVKFMDTNAKSARRRHAPRSDSWPKLPFMDLMDVVRNEPFVVRGAMSFKLKAVSKALHKLGLIDVDWPSNSQCDQGLSAMTALFLCHMNATKKGVSMRDLPLMQEIVAYNRIDCLAMLRIAEYIEQYHVRPEVRETMRIGQALRH